MVKSSVRRKAVQALPSRPIFNCISSVTPHKKAVPPPTSASDLCDLDTDLAEFPWSECPNSRVVAGECDAHGHKRWYRFPCKGRDCPHCGPLTCLQHAKRINYGIEALGDCWFGVFTFELADAENPSYKSRAVRRLGDFIHWARRRLGFHFEYSLSWELQKRGRLHCNLIMNYAGRLPFSEFNKKWGAWVRWTPVTDSRGLAMYCVKSASRGGVGGGLGAYCLKKGYQALPAAWGRRVGFSKGWPKMPAPVKDGRVKWRYLDRGESLQFFIRQANHNLKAMPDGGFGEAGADCDCFNFRPWRMRLRRYQEVFGRVTVRSISGGVDGS